MITPIEKEDFLKNGYLVIEDIVSGEYLTAIRDAFEEVWQNEVVQNTHVPSSSLRALLKYPVFQEIIEYPPILDRHKAVFGERVQLLQADLIRQAPHTPNVPERAWHRDFHFPGERPLTINTLLFIDDITLETGPTRVVPGSHCGEALPPHELAALPLPGEVAVTVPAGSAIFINAAIWHTGGRNVSQGLRRAVALYYGQWFMKRFDGLEEGKHNVPEEAWADASDQRLVLLGKKTPDPSWH